MMRKDSKKGKYIIGFRTHENTELVSQAWCFDDDYWATHQSHITGFLVLQ